MMGRQRVGQVGNLFVYPVKSMRGVEVEELDCYWYGANGDRKYGFTQVGDMTGFPWLTGRELPALLTYAPYFVDASKPLSSAVRVRTPEGGDLALEGEALREELGAQFRGKMALLKLKRGTFDCMPLSLISRATVEALAQGDEVIGDVRRYRPNILLDTVEGFDEDSWAGATLVFGEGEDGAVIQVSYAIKRCVMVNLHPDGGARDARVLKRVARERDSLAGMYAMVSKPGVIRVGDAIYAQFRDE